MRQGSKNLLSVRLQGGSGGAVTTLSPFQGFVIFRFSPTAYAVGSILNAASRLYAEGLDPYLDDSEL